MGTEACPKCGDQKVPTRAGRRTYCPSCYAAGKSRGGSAGGRVTRIAARMTEKRRPPGTPFSHFTPPMDPVMVAEHAWRRRVLAAAHRGDRDALLALWDVLVTRLPLVEARTGWKPPKGRPRQGNGGRPWVAQLGMGSEVGV